MEPIQKIVVSYKLIFVFTWLLLANQLFGQNDLPILSVEESSLPKTDSSNTRKQMLTLPYLKLEIPRSLDIGFGKNRAIHTVGAINKIKNTEFRQGRLNDPLHAIQGYLPGVNIVKNGGDPNKPLDINIRGRNSIYGNTEPLYVIDGLIGADPTLLNVNEIETITVLQDIASTAIYGIRGSNGVILIETKLRENKSKEASSTISYSNFISLDRPTKILDVLTADEFRTYVAENNLQNTTDNGANTDWVSQLYQNSVSQNHHISIYQQTQKTSYRISYAFNELRGVMRNSSRTRHLINGGLSRAFLGDKLQLNIQGFASWQKRLSNHYDNPNQLYNLLHHAVRQRPTDPIYNKDGGYYSHTDIFQNRNPLQLLDYNTQLQQGSQYFGIFNTTYSFNNHLSLHAVAGGGINNTEDFATEIDYYDTTKTNPVRNWESKRYFNYISGHLNYNIAQKGNNVTATAGYSWEGRFTDRVQRLQSTLQPTKIKANDLEQLKSLVYNSEQPFTDNSDGLHSFFSRIHYHFNNRYLINVSARHDRSLKFSTTPTTGNFYGLSLGWNIHNESFLKGIEFLNQLKPWISYGLAGGNQLPEFIYITQYEFYTYIDPATGEEKISRRPIGNSPDTNPGFENTSEWNYGLDFSLFSNRIKGRLNYYNRFSTNIYRAVRVPSPPNLIPYSYDRSLEFRNSGLAISISTTNLLTKKINWSTNLSLLLPKQSLNFLDDNGEISSGFVSGRRISQGSINTQLTLSGDAIGDYYLTNYLGQSDDGASLYRATNGGVTRDAYSAKRYSSGSSLPKAIIGIQNRILLFKNIEFDIHIRGIFGHSIYNVNRNLYAVKQDIGLMNALQSAVDGKDAQIQSSYAVSDFYLEKADFVRIDYTSIGYHLSFKENVQVSGLKLFISSNDLWTWTNFSGLDPELNFSELELGLENVNSYVRYRNICLGFEVYF